MMHFLDFVYAVWLACVFDQKNKKEKETNALTKKRTTAFFLIKKTNALESKERKQKILLSKFNHPVLFLLKTENHKKKKKGLLKT